jgi:hypothetical protein
MKEVDENAPYCSEVDDYDSESREVMKRQGSAFPYTRGLWFICMVVSALCPGDLDDLDERRPLTEWTLATMLGRDITPEEYRYYLSKHPSKSGGGCHIQ